MCVSYWLPDYLLLAVRGTHEEHSVNVMLLVAIAEGQDILTDSPQVLENDNDML